MKLILIQTPRCSVTVCDLFGVLVTLKIQIRIQGKIGINQNLEFMKSLKFMLWFYTNLDIGFICPIKN